MRGVRKSVGGGGAGGWGRIGGRWGYRARFQDKVH